MENMAVSVRVAGDAIALLSNLSEKLGQSKAQVIEMALKQMEERMFWDEVRAAFSRIAADSGESMLVKSEAELWDQGTAREFQPG